MTVGIEDIEVPPRRPRSWLVPTRMSTDVEKQYRRGLITEEERYQGDRQDLAGRDQADHRGG